MKYKSKIFDNSLFLLFLLMALFFLSCARPSEEKEIKKAKDTIEVVFEGIIVPSKEEKIVSPISGKVSKVYAEKGKKVIKNQKLVEFDKYELKLDYNKAKADYEKAIIAVKYYEPEYVVNRVLINNAKDRLLKTYELYKANMASLAELKSAEDNYMDALMSDINNRHVKLREDFERSKLQKQGLKDIEKARYEMERAKYKILHSDIFSPIDGYLTEFNVFVGQNLSEGEVIGSVVNIEQVVLKGAISPGTYKYIKPGMGVNISCVTVPPVKIEGVINEVSPVIDPQTGRMSIYILLNNPEYLLQPGVKCLISKVMPKSQVKESGMDVKEEKIHVKSDLKSPEIK